MLEGHTGECGSVVFSPDGGRLASGPADDVRLWNVQTGAVLQVITDHGAGVAYSPGGRLIVPSSWDKSVRVWDAVTGLQVSMYTGHLDAVTCVAFSADGQRVASADKFGNVHVWSVDAAYRPEMVLVTSDFVIWLGFLSLNRLLFVSWSGSIEVWDLEPRLCIEKRDRHLGEITGFAVAPDLKLAASSSRSGDTITIWDVQTWTKTSTIIGGPGHPERPPFSFKNPLSFSPNSAYLATATGPTGASCQIWDVRTRKRIHEFQGHVGKIMSVQFSPDGSLLATASCDGTVRLWELHVGESLHRDSSICQALSQRGTIFTTIPGRTLEVWMVESNELLWTRPSGSHWMRSR